MRHFKSAFFRIAVSFGTLGVVVYLMRGNISRAYEILRTDVIWGWFALANVAYFVAILILSTRQFYIYRSQGLRLTYARAVYLSFIGLFFNLMLPSALGGDVAKIYYVAKHTGKKMEAVSAVVQDRLVGFFTMILMAITALFFVGNRFHESVHRIVYIFLGVLAVVVLLIFHRGFAARFRALGFLIPSEKLRFKIGEFYEAVSQLRHHGAVLWLSLLLSLAGQVGIIFLYYFLAHCLGADIGLGMFFLLVPLVAIVSMAPSIGGLGVREAGVIFFFKTLMPAERALVLSILILAVVYGFSFVSGIVYAARGGLKAKELHEIEALEDETETGKAVSR